MNETNIFCKGREKEMSIKFNFENGAFQWPIL